MQALSRSCSTEGSNVSILADEDFTALHFCAQNGAEMLIKAGADMEAPTSKGYTPIHTATFDGHWQMVRALVDAGANPDSRLPDGETPLFAAAYNGHVRTIQELLRAGANPVLTRKDRSGDVVVPLDVAAGAGNSEAVRELIQRFGIEGCGGPSAGICALCQATRWHRMDVMALLADAGVVDKTGRVLLVAVAHGDEAPVKLLLQQRKGNRAAQVSYVNICIGTTPLLTAIQVSCSWSPRVARMLVDAGADTTSVLVLPDAPGGQPQHTPKPLSLVSGNIVQLTLQELVGSGESTEVERYRLAGIRRLLLQVEAVHAISWSWPSVGTPVISCLGEDASGGGMTTSTPLRIMLPVLRRRSGRRSVLSAAMAR